jgi:hypothetical protein
MILLISNVITTAEFLAKSIESNEFSVGLCNIKYHVSCVCTIAILNLGEAIKK